MATTLWQVPVPSTALLDGGPVFEKRARREVALRMSYETEEAVLVVALVFEGVEAFKVTYDRARGDWMLDAYDLLMRQFPEDLAAQCLLRVMDQAKKRLPANWDGSFVPPTAGE